MASSALRGTALRLLYQKPRQKMSGNVWLIYSLLLLLFIVLDKLTSLPWVSPFKCVSRIGKKILTFLHLSSRVPHPKTTSLAPVFLSPNHGCPPTPLIQPLVPPHQSPDGTLLRRGVSAALEENQTIELLVERCHDMPPGVVWLAVTSRFGNQPLKTSQVGVST